MTTKTKSIIIFFVFTIITVLLVVFNADRRDELIIAVDGEFLTRPDGFYPLMEHYDIEMSGEPTQMEQGLMYRALAEGSVDVADVYFTDGRVELYDLMILEDDRAFFPPYFAAPLVRADTLEKYPEIKSALSILSGQISGDEMRRLNYLVDETGQKPEEIAYDFLVKKDLIRDKKLDDKVKNVGTVTVGGKNFNESEILGNVLAIIIEDKTDLEVEKRLNLGGTMIAFNALKAGDVDLYVEYTGTGLMSILKEDVIKNPDESYSYVKERFRDLYGMVWFDPFGFNNSYALGMRRKHASKLGIETISDLADYIKEINTEE